MALTTETLKTESLKPIHWLVVGLIVVTGVVHLYVVGVQETH
jgi:hypothetical protein